MQRAHCARRQNGRWTRLLAPTLLATVVVLCALAAPRGASAADEADKQAALRILQRTAATYQKLQSYEFKVTIHLTRGPVVAERRLTESGERPGKFRIEDDDAPGTLHVGDGHSEWVIAAGATTHTAESATPISDFENIDQHVADAVIMREEHYIAEGKPVLVYVVAVARDRWPPGTLPGAQFMMYRIDEQSFAVHEVTTHTPDTVNVTQMAVYSIVKWNEPVPESDFDVAPPKSEPQAASAPETTPAVQVTSLIGTQAPDFTLQDTNWKTVSLHDFRGKVVIVDFWASWCGPCRAQMPRLQDLYRKLADKGLVVLGLDIGEDSQTVTRFASQTSYTFTLLLGCEPEVDTKYYVGALPTTFVVDRQGKIAYRDEGLSPPEDLDAAVKAALQ